MQGDKAKVRGTMPGTPVPGFRVESWWQSETAPGAFFLLSVGFECDKLITARRAEKKVDCRMKAATHSSRTGCFAIKSTCSGPEGEREWARAAGPRPETR